MSLPSYTILSYLRVRLRPMSDGDDSSDDDGDASDDSSEYGDGPMVAKYREAEEGYGIRRSELMGWALEDLLGRVIDWKGYNVEDFGKLLQFDRIPICTSYRPSFRLYYVYLFERLVLCCREKGFGLEEKACLVRIDSRTLEVIDGYESLQSDSEESEDEVREGLERVEEEEEEEEQQGKQPQYGRPYSYAREFEDEVREGLERVVEEEEEEEQKGEQPQYGRPYSYAREFEDEVRGGLERVVEEEEPKEEDQAENLEDDPEELPVHTVQTLEDYLEEENIPDLILQGRVLGASITEIISFTTHESYVVEIFWNDDTTKPHYFSMHFEYEADMEFWARELNIMKGMNPTRAELQAEKILREKTAPGSGCFRAGCRDARCTEQYEYL